MGERRMALLYSRSTYTGLYGGYLLLEISGVPSSRSTRQLWRDHAKGNRVHFGEVTLLFPTSIDSTTTLRCFIDLSLLALQSGICTGYFVFVANMASDISPWIASLSFSTKVNFPTYRFPIESSQQVFIQAVVIAPLCWFRQVSNLSFTNLLANVGCPILVIIIHSVYYTQFCSDPYCMQPLWPHRLHRNRRPWSVPSSNEASDLSPYQLLGWRFSGLHGDCAVGSCPPPGISKFLIDTFSRVLV